MGPTQLGRSFLLGPDGPVVTGNGNTGQIEEIMRGASFKESFKFIRRLRTDNIRHWPWTSVLIISIDQ